MLEYTKRLVEVDEILNHLSIIEYLKIPNKVLEGIKQNKDKNYKWKYDETKPLNEQDISKDTVAILAYICTDYLLNDKQKELMDQIYNINEKKEEKKKAERYGSDNIFKKKNHKSITEQNIEEKSIVKYKESWVDKIITKIKKFFIKN